MDNAHRVQARRHQCSPELQDGVLLGDAWMVHRDVSNVPIATKKIGRLPVDGERLLYFLVVLENVQLPVLVCDGKKRLRWECDAGW